MAWAGSEGSSGDGSRHSAAPGPLHAGDQRAPITLRQCFDLVLKVHARCAVDIGRCCAAKRASGTSSCFLAVATLGSALRPGTPRRHVLLLTQRARSGWRPALCLSVPKLRSTTPVPCAQHNTGRTSLLLPCDVRLRGKASLARCCGSGLSAACASSWRDGDHGRSVQPAEAWATAALRTPATAADGHGERAHAGCGQRRTCWPLVQSHAGCQQQQGERRRLPCISLSLQGTAARLCAAGCRAARSCLCWACLAGT